METDQPDPQNPDQVLSSKLEGLPVEGPSEGILNASPQLLSEESTVTVAVVY